MRGDIGYRVSDEERSGGGPLYAYLDAIIIHTLAGSGVDVILSFLVEDLHTGIGADCECWVWG
jgi:hypothetical protein